MYKHYKRLQSYNRITRLELHDDITYIDDEEKHRTSHCRCFHIAKLSLSPKSTITIAICRRHFLFFLSKPGMTQLAEKVAQISKNRNKNVPIWANLGAHVRGFYMATDSNVNRDLQVESCIEKIADCPVGCCEIEYLCDWDCDANIAGERSFKFDVVEIYCVRTSKKVDVNERDVLSIIGSRFVRKNYHFRIM